VKHISEMRMRHRRRFNASSSKNLRPPWLVKMVSTLNYRYRFIIGSQNSVLRAWMHASRTHPSTVTGAANGVSRNPYP